MDIPSSFFQKCFNYGLHKNSPFGTKFFVRLIFEAFSRKKPPKGGKSTPAGAQNYTFANENILGKQKTHPRSDVHQKLYKSCVQHIAGDTYDIR